MFELIYLSSYVKWFQTDTTVALTLLTFNSTVLQNCNPKLLPLSGKVQNIAFCYIGASFVLNQYSKFIFNFD